MKSKYLRLRVPEGEGSEVIEYESKEPYFGWYSKDKLNIPGIGSSVSVCSIDTNIYILGVSDKRKTVYKYDTITNTYSNLAEMLYAKFIPTVSVIDGMIYISGGRGDNSYVPLEYAPVILKYNPATNIWYDIGRTIERRMFASSFVMNGKIYICGGQTYPNNGNGNSNSTPLTNLNSVEIFDLETGASAYVKSLPFNLYQATSYIKNNKAYLFGGISQVNAYLDGATTKVIEYDPNLGELIVSSVSFSENIDIPEKTVPSGSLTFNINGDWYMVGGNGPKRYFKKYNSIDKIWEDKTLMLKNVYDDDTTCVVVGNVVYIVSGYEYVQYYDSLTETWSMTIIPFITPGSIRASSPSPICYMQGYLYVVMKFSIYKYDIANNIWSTVYTMAEDRRYASYFTSGDDIYMYGGNSPPIDKYCVKYNTVTSTLTVLPTVYVKRIFIYEDNVYAIRSYDSSVCIYDISTNNWVKKGYIGFVNPSTVTIHTIHTYDAGLYMIYHKGGVRYATRMDINRNPCGVWQETIPMRVPRALPGIIEQENALLLVGGSNSGYNTMSLESYNMDTAETTEPVRIEYETEQSYHSVPVNVNGNIYTLGGGGATTVCLLKYIPKDLSFVKKKFYRHIHKKPELDVALIDSTYIPQPGEFGEGFVSEYYPMYHDPDGTNPLFNNDMMYGFCISDKVYAFGITPGSTLPRKVVMNLTDKTYTITDYTTENANTIPTVTATQCIEFVINGKGYLCNGKMYFDPESTDGIGDPLFAATIQYDPVLDSWTRMADMLLSESLRAPAAAVANGLAYVIGSTSGQPTEIEIFDPVANNWERVTDVSIHSDVSYGTAAFYDGLIYVLADYNYHPYVFRFDPVTRVTSMTSARAIRIYYDNSTSFVLNEKLIVTTGSLGDRVEVYDSQTNVWSMSGDPGVPHLYGDCNYGRYIISGVYNNTAYIFHAEGCSIIKPADFIKKINMTEIIENDDTDTSDCILAVRISESVPS